MAENHSYPKIALLCGVPTNAKDFARQRSTSDFLERYPTHQAFPESYRKYVADPIKSLVRSVAGFPFVQVQHKGTLSKLTEATSNSDVVIILSHWKGPTVSNNDMPRNDGIIDRDRIHRTLAESNRPEAVSLLDKLNANMTDPLWETLNGAVYREVPNTMNVDSRSLAFEGDEELFWAYNRRTLDEIWPLRPGNRLELMDGLHSAEEVAAAIAPDFIGTIDLVACRSSYLGSILSEHFNYQFRVVAFPEVQKFDTHVEVVKLVLGYVSQGVAYLEARQLARIKFEALVKRELSNRWLRRWKKCLSRQCY